MAGDTVHALMEQMEAAGRRAAALRPPTWPEADEDARGAYLAAAGEHRACTARLHEGPTGELVRLREGVATPADVDYALTFLDADPYFFRSGFLRERVARHLARAVMTTRQRDRARDIVVRAVAGSLHIGQPGLGRLAGAVANNSTREVLRARLHDDEPKAWRALQTLLSVKHPGYQPADIAAARTVALHHRSVRGAMRFWSPEWEAELRAVAQRHDPDRAAARHLLRYVDARRQRRASRMRASP